MLKIISILLKLNTKYSTKMMKNFVFLFILVCSKSIAQDPSKFRFGPYIGAGMTRITEWGNSDRSRFTPVLGLASEYRINPILSFVGNISYIRMGQTTELFQTPSALKLKTSFHTLTIPLLARISPGKSNFFCQVGVQPGFTFKYRAEIDKEYLDNSSNYDKVTFGAIGGLGMYINNFISLDIRYYQGLLNILKSDTFITETPGSTVQIDKQKHKFLAMGLSYYF